MNADLPGSDDYDLALLDRFRLKGEREALGELFLRHMGTAYRLTRRFFRDSHEAEDAVQTAFLQVMLRAKEFQGRSTVKTWLLAIVVNACRMKQRGARRRELREQHARPAETAEVASPDAQQLYAAVVKNLETLPEDFRLPVWMHYCEGLSFGEIAQALLISEPSARRHAKRGLELLRGAMPALTVGAVTSLLAAVPAEAAPATLPVALNQLAATPLQLLPAAPAAGKALSVGAALKAACVVALATAGAVFAFYGERPTALARSRGAVELPPAAPMPEEVPGPIVKPIPARAAIFAPSAELQKILERKIRLRLTGDYLSDALNEIRVALPRGVELSVSTTEACWQGPWPGVKFEAAEIRVDDALKQIAEQLRLRLAVRGSEIFFWRELAAAERAKLNERLRDRALGLDARLEAARDLLRCGDIDAMAGVLRALLEQPEGLARNGPGFTQALLPILRTTMGYRLTEDPAWSSPLVLLGGEAPLRAGVLEWLAAQNWAMGAEVPAAFAELDAETLRIRRAAVRDFNLRLAAIFDCPDYLLGLSPEELRGSTMYSWALAFVQEKRCDEVLWKRMSNPGADGKEAALALGARRDARAVAALTTIAKREDGSNESLAERAVQRLARYDHAATNAGAILEQLMCKDARRPAGTAAEEFGRRGDPARVRGLLRFIESKDTPQDLYHRATLALTQLRDPALDATFLKLLREQHLPDSDALADCFAATRNPATIDALGALMLDPAFKDGGAACNALGGMHSRAAVAKLIELYPKLTAEDQSASVLRGLGLAHDAQSEAFLAELTAGDNPPRLRFIALECLRRTRTEAGMAALRRTAFDPSPNIRVIALNTLIHVDSDAAREILMQALAGETDSTIRGAPPSCAKYFGNWDLNARRKLFAALRDAYKKDPPIRFALLRNLSSDLGSKETRELMEQALTETDKSLPYIAVEELLRREETYVEGLELLLGTGRFNNKLRIRAAAIFLYPTNSENRPLDEERLHAAFKTLRKSAETDTEPLVRLAAVYSLNRDRENPVTVQLLKAMARKDPSAQVRGAVDAVLTGEVRRDEAIRTLERSETPGRTPIPERNLEF